MREFEAKLEDDKREQERQHEERMMFLFTSVMQQIMWPAAPPYPPCMSTESDPDTPTTTSS